MKGRGYEFESKDLGSKTFAGNVLDVARLVIADLCLYRFDLPLCLVGLRDVPDLVWSESLSQGGDAVSEAPA
jgi:hypothetical protein